MALFYPWKVITIFILFYMLPNTVVDDVSVKDVSSCEEGWEYHDLSCYKLENRLVNWTDASNNCKSMGGHLASIHSKEQNVVLEAFATRTAERYCWIGLQDIDLDSIFTWDDETDVDYTNWSPAEPDGHFSAGNCVVGSLKNITVRFPLGNWLVLRCSVDLPFLCQKKATSLNTNMDLEDTIEISTIASRDVVTETINMLTSTVVDDVSVKDLSSCEEGWEHHDLYCYKLGNRKLEWTDASHDCKSMGGHLASIHSKEQNDVLESFATRTNESFCWIGLQDIELDSIYAWDDETDVGYTNWSPEEPDGHYPFGNCVVVSLRKGNVRFPVGNWLVLRCDLGLTSLCQKKATFLNTSIDLEDTTIEISTITSTDVVTETTTFLNTSIDLEDTTINMIPNTVVDHISVKYLSSCEEGWKHHDRYCYKLGNRLLNWKDASQNCKSMGGHLASIHSKEQNDVLKAFATRTDEEFCWIGLQDIDLDSIFAWDDETDVDYTNWSPAEPDGHFSVGNCVEMSFTRFNVKFPLGNWLVIGCSYERTFLCQKKIEISAITSTDVATETIYMLPYTVVDDVSVKDLSSCGEGWEHHDLYCYKLGNRLLKWTDASHDCKSMGGHLASIHSKEQNDVLESFAARTVDDHCWIGLQDLDLDSIFAWDDETGVDYTNWSPEEPDGHFWSGNCVAVSFRNDSVRFPFGNWVVLSCHIGITFLCQKKATFLNTSIDLEDTTITSLNTIMESEDTTINMIPNTVVDDISVKDLSSCEEGWEHHDRYCYKLGNHLLNWTDASQNCKSMGGHLASIHSKEQNDVLEAFATRTDQEYCWIGLQDIDLDSIFAWDDESNVDYANWNSEEPDGHFSSGNCVEISFTNNLYFSLGYWLVIGCSSERTFLCQKKIATSATSADTDSETIATTAITRTDVESETSFISVTAYVITLIIVIVFMALMGSIFYYKRQWLEEKCGKISFRRSDRVIEPSTEFLMEQKGTIIH